MSTPGDASRMVVRMGFVVDVVGYGSRSATAKVDAQQRLATLVHEVLRDLGLDLAATDHQGTGDGMVVFFPTTVEVHRALPRLIRAAAGVLTIDNERYRDRLRLRMAVVLGPLGPAAIGYSGNTVVEGARMVDSQVLREAIRTYPEADLAVLVSEQLYSYVVGERHPGMDATEFQLVDVRAKDLQTRAWLWVGPVASRLPAGPAPAHGRDEAPLYALVSPYHSPCVIGVLSGNIRRVRTVDIWVNSENTDMEMSRFNDFSISGLIRYQGARRDATGRVTTDVIADELATRVGDRRPVAPCSVFVTQAGALTDSNNVRHIIHVAAVHGEPGEGFRQVRDIGACVTNALSEADRLAAADASVRTILFPLLGVGVAGASVGATVAVLIESSVDYLVATPETRLGAIYLLGYTEAERVALVDALARTPGLEPSTPA